MSYSLVDGYSSDQEVTLPNGQTFPVPSLVEGERGERILLSLGEEIPVTIWADASMSGAEGIYRPTPNPRYVAAGDFTEHAILNELKASYSLPEFIWSLSTPFDSKVAQEPSQAREEASSEEESLFVHLHTHSEFSALDGYSTMEEIVTRIKAMGQTAVAVTDHGVCSGHPDLQKACDAAGIKPIFGMEAYLVEDRFDRTDHKSYQHICLWAIDDRGLRNLWAISTEGYRDGFHGHPRIDYDTLTRLGSGVIASSACLRGPLSEPYLRGDVSQALVNLTRLTDIFGDRFYIELHCNQLPDQIRVNKWLVEKANEFEIPLIATVDSHYTHLDQRDDHQVWLAMETGKDVSQESTLFGGGQQYHLMDETEIIASLSYLDEETVIKSMLNTVTFADRCTARIVARTALPTYSHGADAYEKDADALLELCLANWDERTAGKNYTQEQAQARFEREFVLLVAKKYCGYFLANADLVSHAKDSGIKVGPGRGSGAGSFVAYLSRITEVDPIENDILFERFMTEGRTSLPDFDIDYPSSRKQDMITYAETRWGKQHVCAVGTHTRIKNKGAFKDTARAIKSRLPEGYFQDGEKISKIITVAEATTAGLGLSWDQLMDVAEEDLAPYKERMPYLFEMAEKFRSRLKTYSRHAAGLVIDSKENLEGSLPMFLSSDDRTLVTQWDKDVLEELGYVKFDFLNLRNLDTIQDTVDLIYQQTGDQIEINKWRDEYRDPQVFADICNGWTLGLFQLETALGTRTVKQLKPQSLADLSDSITLGRPGPIRSGLDKLYFRRRSGEEEVSYPDQRLKEVLSKTYGVMLYQEDIMNICIILANYSGDEADHVRKILGKKKPELAAKEGQKFIARAVKNNTDKSVATSLWEQMAEFALYSFNRAHAFSYATLAYWTAWLKHHYPAQFMTACLSTIDKDDIPSFVSESRRMGYQVLPPDINDSKVGFTSNGLVVRYGLESIKGVGEVASSAIMSAQPFKDWDDFMERKGKCDMGQVKILAHIGAFDALVPNRKALEMRLQEEDVKAAERCIFWQLERNEYDLPCNFDWKSEPPKLGRTGKPLRVQPPPPKKCTKACRQYVQRPMPSNEDVVPYTPAEIRDIELEYLGVYLSSSPFDRIDAEDLELLVTADELQTKPNGTYLSAILITGERNHRDSNGNLMKFITASTPSGNMDLTVFSSGLEKFGGHVKIGQMALVELFKNEKGSVLKQMEPI